jgi:hypothetical protein
MNAIRCALLLVALSVLAACGGGGVSTLPVKGHASAPSTPGPGATGTLTPAQITTAFQNVEATYQGLPHTSTASDLSALAAQMVSSGAFKSAIVSTGGISARLPDGTPVLIFADRFEDLGTTASSSRIPASSTRVPLDAPLSPSNPHETALFVNESDTSGAFVPTRQFAFGNAFSRIESPAVSGYGVDAVDMSIENLVSIGKGHPLDFLDIATHGMIGSDPDTPLATNTYYAWLSTTPVTQALISTYQTDYNAGNLLSAMYLTLSKQTISLNTFAFTPTFLTEHVTFNPGAIVDNQSCWGQSPIIASNVQGVLQAAGVGRYLGWTKEVAGNDADETDAFIFDHMLGEQSPSVTLLDTYVNQKTPPQRPFPLDQIETVLAESRNTKLQPPNPTGEPYTLSDVGIALNAIAPPSADKTAARLIISDFGGEGVANPPLEYAFPSIATMQVAEGLTSGTLTIMGSFPASSGTAQITDGSGTTKLTPTAWATDHVTFTLPADGNGSAGSVQVLSSAGIASNAVPLTQWRGQLAYSESDTLLNLSGQSGSGTGTIAVTFNVAFRGDVHPTVVQIDAAAQPQNFYFSMPEGDSTAVVTAFNATFETSDGMHDATFSLNPSAPPMTVAPPPLPPQTFDIGPLAGQPASCNNALPGPQSGASNVFCPKAGFVSSNVGLCSDDAGTLCPGTNFSPSFAFGQGTVNGDGLLMLTMDPSTYAVTVSATPAAGQSGHFGGGNRPATGTITGTLQAAAFPPGSTTAASLHRTTH